MTETKNANGLYQDEPDAEEAIIVKPETVRIRSMQVVPYAASKGVSFIIFGIGGDDKPYRWNGSEKQWEL